MDDLDARRRRAQDRRIYLLAREPNATFHVAGLTSDYRVQWRGSEEDSKCTCPDYTRRHRACKHVLFIATRVLAAGESSAAPAERTLGHKRPRQDDKDCSICFDTLEDDDVLEVCGTCGHAFHVPCLQRWRRFGGHSCPLCRQ